MSLNLTYADNADAVLRRRRQLTGRIIAALLFLFLLAATLGMVISPDPIRCCVWS